MALMMMIQTKKTERKKPKGKKKSADAMMSASEYQKLRAKKTTQTPPPLPLLTQHSKSNTSSHPGSSLPPLPTSGVNTIPLLFHPPRLMKKSGPSIPPGGPGRLITGVLGPLPLLMVLGVDAAEDFPPSPNPKSNPS
jgi:hypothetical protein